MKKIKMNTAAGLVMTSLLLMQSSAFALNIDCVKDSAGKVQATKFWSEAIGEDAHRSCQQFASNVTVDRATTKQTLTNGVVAQQTEKLMQNQLVTTTVASTFAPIVVSPTPTPVPAPQFLVEPGDKTTLTVLQKWAKVANLKFILNSVPVGTDFPKHAVEYVDLPLLPQHSKQLPADSLIAGITALSKLFSTSVDLSGVNFVVDPLSVKGSLSVTSQLRKPIAPIAAPDVQPASLTPVAPVANAAVAPEISVAAPAVVVAAQAVAQKPMALQNIVPVVVSANPTPSTPSASDPTRKELTTLVGNIPPPPQVSALPAPFTILPSDKSIIGVLARWAALQGLNTSLNGVMVEMAKMPSHPVPYTDFGLTNTAKNLTANTEFVPSVQALMKAFANQDLSQFKMQLLSDKRVLVITSNDPIKVTAK